MNAEKFYKGSIDLKHFPAEEKENGACNDDGELSQKQPLTEYRKQFPLLPSNVYSRVLASNLNVNNNNSNVNNDNDDAGVSSKDPDYDIISHLPQTGVVPSPPAAAAVDPDSTPMSPSGVDFLVRTSLPVPPMRPTSASDFNTEYRRSFKPFDAFKYVDGAFKEVTLYWDE